MAATGQQESAQLTAEDVREIARQIASVGQRVLATLEAAGFTRAMRAAPAFSLHLLGRALPHQSLDDLLTESEAFAFITVPSALARNDLKAIATDAEHFLTIFAALLRIIIKQRRPSALTSITGSMQAPMLRMALDRNAVLDGIEQLADLFESLTGAGGASAKKRRGMLATAAPVWQRFFMPGLVIVVVLGLVGFLISAVRVTPGGKIAIAPPNLGAQNTPAGTVTATTGVSATVTPLSSTPRLSVSQLNQAPCPVGTTSSFTITYSGGQGQVSWTATADNSGNVALSKDSQSAGGSASGTLAPGEHATVYVRALVDATGQIQVRTSSGLGTSVAYDSNDC